jgi:putative tryptophan/tyrosine transport system substrate-binding protein
MNRRSWLRGLDSFSDNRKSKIENLKQLGLAVIALVVVVTGTVAQAQTPKRIPRIGYLGGGSAELEKPWIDSLRQGLRDWGYVESKNILIEGRYAAGRYEQLPALAAELIALKVNVILAASTPVALSAKKTTTSTPIVMVVADPVGTGLIASLARPGGNITGLSDFHADLVTKRLELLKEVIPSLSRVAVLSNPASVTCSAQLKELNAAGPGLGLTLVTVEARQSDDLPQSFSTIKKELVGGVFVCGDRMFNTHRTTIFDLANKNRLPAIYSTKEYAETGGLMSYGANFPDLYRRAATYVDKILKGAKPADLPVEQPTKFELVINLKTANQIGLTIPPNVLARADRVIK